MSKISSPATQLRRATQVGSVRAAVGKIFEPIEDRSDLGRFFEPCPNDSGDPTGGCGGSADRPVWMVSDSEPIEISTSESRVADPNWRDALPKVGDKILARDYDDRPWALATVERVDSSQPALPLVTVESLGDSATFRAPYQFVLYSSTASPSSPPKVEVGTVDLLDILTKDLELPKGYDRWGIKSVHPDLITTRGYRYPWPGKTARPAGPFLEHRGSCPRAEGDGLCVGLSWKGMASGGIPATTLLLVAWKSTDLLGDSEQDEGKLRVAKLKVVDVIDGARLLRESGKSANLYGANLRSADLRSADLYGANLRSADLYGANLRSADLYGANLRSADLRSADLYGANLRSADLYGANLRSADLYGANLRSADLYGANLRSANLRSADLYGANLRSADLYGANLTQEQLSGALTDKWTRLPSGIVVPE